MSDNLLKTGIVGSILAAVCCATPVLVLALGTIGLSTYAAKLDYVLIPLLVFFVLLTLYAWKRHIQLMPAACQNVAPHLKDPNNE